MLHTIVFDTCFSPCGRFLAAANKFGQVAIFSLESALSSEVKNDAKLPIFTFKVYKSGAIYSLTSTGSLLICAGEGDVQAYKWSNVIAKNAKLQWALSVPQKAVFSHPEINSCVVSSSNGNSHLHAGAGDKLVHTWDIDSGTYLGNLKGHTDYVHAVVAKHQGQGLVSASEDGTARIWDLRSNEAVQVIKPFENEMCARPEMGRWLQCLAIDADDYWLLVGGGPRMAAWHLNTLTPTVTFDSPGEAQQVGMFHQDKIFSAGSKNVLNHWTITGDHTMAVPVSSSAIYSIRINPHETANKVMVLSGSSEKIDVCMNHGYTAFSLSFVP